MDGPYRGRHHRPVGGGSQRSGLHRLERPRGPGHRRRDRAGPVELHHRGPGQPQPGGGQRLAVHGLLRQELLRVPPARLMNRSRGQMLAAAAPALALILAITPSSMADPGPQIHLSPQVGPPTTRLTVVGRGFGPSEAVDLSFDSRPRGRATTDPSGAFTAHITVPKGALPGDHTVTATGESSGLSASAPFTVRTDWPMFKYGPDHTGVNPYENVLSPSTVGGLQVGWTFGPSGVVG